jgi:hypothetical protein
MIRFIFLRFIAVTPLIGALAACASSPSDSSLAEAAIPAEKSLRLMPVYVVPNCKAIGGIQNCQWIEPRGYESPAHAPTKAQRVDGIAL